MNDGLKASGQATVATEYPRVARLKAEEAPQLTADVAAFILPVDNPGRFVILIDADALGPWTIQGIVDDGLADSFYVLNTGVNHLLLGHQDLAADVRDRIIIPTGLDLRLDVNEMAVLWYDLTATRWRVLETSGA